MNINNEKPKRRLTILSNNKYIDLALDDSEEEKDMLRDVLVIDDKQNQLFSGTPENGYDRVVEINGKSLENKTLDELIITISQQLDITVTKRLEHKKIDIVRVELLPLHPRRHDKIIYTYDRNNIDDVNQILEHMMVNLGNNKPRIVMSLRTGYYEVVKIGSTDTTNKTMNELHEIVRTYLLGDCFTTSLIIDWDFNEI